MNRALNLLRRLLENFFEEKDVEKVVALLSVNVQCYGLPDRRALFGVEEIRAFSEEVPFRRVMAGELSIWEEKAILLDGNADMAEIGFTVEYEGIRHDYRITGTSRVENGRECLCVLHYSSVTSISSREKMLEKLMLAAAEEEEKKRRELSVALNQAEQAGQAKTDFLSRMSHEIRTPMNAIMGMTAVARENVEDPLQIADCLNKIDISSKYLLNLINDILQMSRIESGRTDIVHEEFSYDYLMESIGTIVGTLALDRSVRYEVVSEVRAEAYYCGDMVRIQQVLVNLINNAVKFTKPGGKVKFSSRIVEQTDETAHFRFTVADTGIGMSEGFMSKMFQPFSQENSGTTSEYDGSGLGLAISKNLVELMGGTIEADSFVGIGSTFVVDLPIDRIRYDRYGQRKENKPRTVAAEEENLNGCRILMAEDHPLNITVVIRLLEKKGATLIVAKNGQQAVELFEQSEPGYYDAILMDIRMPVMDGLDATRAIRRMERPDARIIPIIAMTANALEEDRKKTKAAGMDAHLTKPIDPKLLYQTISEYISQK